jgi:hypothetical protein
MKNLSVSTEIRTERLHSTSLERYRFVNPLALKASMTKY